MLNAVVRSLGTVLEPEDLKKACEAYSLAITHICFNDTEFAHLQQRTLATRLAQLIIRLTPDGQDDDAERLSERALSVLRAADLREAA
jgi:hypothetical protein